MLGPETGARVRGFAALGGIDQGALARDDDHQDIGGHDRAHDGPDMDIGAATAEDLRKTEGGGRQQEEQDDAEDRLVIDQRGFTEQVIDDPAAEDRAEADENGDIGGDIGDGAVDQVDVGAEIIQDRQEDEATQPGEIGLIFEPVQDRRDFGRGQAVFLHFIEAAAMYGPELATDTCLVLVSVLGRRGQVHIEPDKIERRPDPGDTGDHMDPAYRQLHPFQ